MERWRGELYQRALVYVLLGATLQVQSQPNPAKDFSHSVFVRCHRGNMTIAVKTEEPFHGVIHTKYSRGTPCLQYGNGHHNTTLVVDLLASQDDPTYCGVHTTKNNEYSLAIAVRMHRTLEVAEDKLYAITCGKTSFRNSRNKLSRVSLQVLEGGKRVSELVYSRQYTLQAAISNPDNIYGMRVKSCLSFSANTTEVNMIDANGCPLLPVISAFRYNRTSHVSDATVYSMFKFPGSNRIYMQCDVVLCKEPCDPVCPTEEQPSVRALARYQNGSDPNHVELTASTSAFVVDPGERVLVQASTECTEWQFPWLVGLCICLAVLLLVMLIVNIFLCSTMSCTCTKTEVIEKDPSDIEDYDPYKVGWSGSHYGSRTSLNKPGYTSACSTFNSGSSVSDHYAVVHSRPSSSSSHRGPGSIVYIDKYSPRI